MLLNGIKKIHWNKIGRKTVFTKKLHMGTAEIKWVNSIMHFDNYINTELTGIIDCDVKRFGFIGYFS